MRPVWCLAILTAVLSPPFARGDEATLTDGQRVAGTLTLDVRGRLTFTAADKSVPLDEIHRVRFNASPPRWPAGSVHRVTMPGGQTVAGTLLGMNDDRLRLRTAWADELTLPRPWVEAVTQPPGYAVVAAEDFEKDPAGWKLTGSAERSKGAATSGEHGLRFTGTGRAEYAPPEPLAAGRLGVNFRATDTTAGARWAVEAEFAGDGHAPFVLRVTVAGPRQEYEADAGPLGPPARVTRTPGWHRLEADFTAGSVVVTVDDDVLIDSRRRGPGGSLRAVRIACVADAGTVRGEVLFDELTLARAVEEARRPAGDPGQDEVWLVTGDQVFGRLAGLTRDGVDLRGKFGSRTLGWGDVRGVFPRRQAPAPQTSEGEHVRVAFSPGVAGLTDELEGVLRRLDERRLTLAHPALGEVTLDRARVGELRWLFRGRRVEIDNAFHHLGDPDAAGWKGTFRLDTVPKGARLVVVVTGLKGRGDSIGAALEKGALRTEVVVNGKAVDHLNRQVERATAEPVRLVVPLSADTLRAGDNTLELRQTPEPDTGRRESCGVFGVVVEIPE
jgi:hypothetical protein